MSRNEWLFLKKGDAVIIRAPLALTEDIRMKACDVLSDAARAVQSGETSRGRK
ncbi:hypothetical protein ASZ90_016686 [hydrocarbon metagenome]|jgi:hypothetical protein|uniref:Uncharacterized protein n=1 Tax=hydrocarbon metagenome TaxID=938273 RepID=A0A0W8EH64_9ZZZZ